MRVPDNSLTAEILGVFGSTGSGKTTWIQRRIKRERSVLVWDAKNEYGSLPGFHRITSPLQLATTLRQRRSGRYAFAAPPAMFPFWCQAVWAWGNCVAVAEELADVTGTGKAVGIWGEMLRKGRGFGIRTIGITQRPSEIDKTLIGNATLIWCGQLTRGSDRAYMARELDLPREKLDRMQKLEYIERDLGKGVISCGKLTF